MTFRLEKEIIFKKGINNVEIKNIKKIINASDEEVRKAFKKLSAKEQLQFIAVLHLYQHEFDYEGNVISRLLTHEVDENYGFNESYLTKHFYHYLRFIKRKRRRIWLNWIESDGSKHKRCLRL